MILGPLAESRGLGMVDNAPWVGLHPKTFCSLYPFSLACSRYGQFRWEICLCTSSRLRWKWFQWRTMHSSYSTDGSHSSSFSSRCAISIKNNLCGTSDNRRVRVCVFVRSYWLPKVTFKPDLHFFHYRYCNRYGLQPYESSRRVSSPFLTLNPWRKKPQERERERESELTMNWNRQAK